MNFVTNLFFKIVHRFMSWYSCELKARYIIPHSELAELLTQYDECSLEHDKVLRFDARAYQDDDTVQLVPVQLVPAQNTAVDRKREADKIRVECNVYHDATMLFLTENPGMTMEDFDVLKPADKDHFLTLAEANA